MKISVKKLLTPVLFVFISNGAPALADWQANTVTRYGKGEQEEVTGRIFVRGPKVRLDMTAPTEMSVIYDQNTKVSAALVHAAKIRLDGGYEQYQERIPVCLPAQIDACFKKLGLKKIRSETIDGQPTDVYHGKKKKSEKGQTEEYDLTIWRPTGMKEVLAVKTLVEMKDGEKVETTFKNISTKPIEASKFVIPKNYIRAGGLDQVLKGLKSFNGN